MTGIKRFRGSKDADKFDEWLKNHQDNGFVIGGFTNDEFTKLWRRKRNEPPTAPLHEANCPTLTRYGKCARLSYGKLCALDEAVLIEECKRLTSITPTKDCGECFKDNTI